ncbi:1-deoxy-D-xylulose-5-phosphate synthase [Desulfotalea psychrophila]|uniref:1-deoxy-D-xylulose-5-phosphate synthase n=1 Tax=Desulfotalea psychrophila (strain LSv54 / DSM 12343) TaxID=177439 RepID=DXS_DESPS|nr:1-deoxy-D-xylulose-5-phosphate synthase [Desulfotalea psychrophila]Q6AJQ1.1 RecName: Full=1-deoxy-D-xylulose-5-phosphate synthase; AltName: Full=1-deoxyxylulose-5-phosphate synthase; Short=DXP synthase; Short=DXPS [Desulfotalea psychrophila LSv54]CAG37429.1 probable 1-deoxy-D-xylulose 5-phosphate synthase [Desulfotalea psychrophila LSv54]
MLQQAQTTSRNTLLDRVDSPKDIRQLTHDDLIILAAEIREKIIDTVSKTGGHLAPSLGVVELTLALHYVFNTPTDKLVWDVGHQSYAHKILTGRRKQFDTLRQYRGMSGFPKRGESDYDAFETGHSSTSISAALGMTLAMDLLQQDNKAIAVIGDGSMTAGMAFEALNHAGHLDKNLIVILNDNEMSISPNVGALSSFLSRKLTGKTMRRVKSHLVEKLQDSDVGENILNVLRKSEESFKSFFTPGMLFEAFKFDYIGPIDGHDIDALISTLNTVRDTAKGPALIHVLTKKGKGYLPAEENPDAFHGVGPFNRQTGKIIKKKGPASYTTVFGQTMLELGKKNKNIVAISAAMVAGTGLTPFSEAYPDRFFDVGIAEQHAITFAAGLASQGMRPVVAIYSSFYQRAMDQIIHDVCIPNLPVTLAIDRAGVVGDDGPTHHGIFDISFLRFIPNLTIMAPKDEAELQQMLVTATGHDGPTAIRYPRGAGEDVSTSQEIESIPILEIGRGELLREGDDILLLPIGNRVYPAMRAAEELAKQGISASVINPRFIKPLDAELICQQAKKTGRIITIEDNTLCSGFGSAVLELLSQKSLYGIKTKILGHPHAFVEHGPQKTLWENSGITSRGIIMAALDLLQKETDPSVANE